MGSRRGYWDAACIEGLAVTRTEECAGIGNERMCLRNNSVAALGGKIIRDGDIDSAHRISSDGWGFAAPSGDKASPSLLVGQMCEGGGGEVTVAIPRATSQLLKHTQPAEPPLLSLYQKHTACAKLPWGLGADKYQWWALNKARRLVRGDQFWLGSRSKRIFRLAQRASRTRHSLCAANNPQRANHSPPPRPRPCPCLARQYPRGLRVRVRTISDPRL
jgi:hypothetical protein